MPQTQAVDMRTLWLYQAHITAEEAEVVEQLHQSLVETLALVIVAELQLSIILAVVITDS